MFDHNFSAIFRLLEYIFHHVFGQTCLLFIAPKASAEGACFFMEVGYYVACMMGFTMESEEWVSVVYVVTLFKANGYYRL